MRAKLGLGAPQPGDDELLEALLAMLHEQKVDHTSFFRVLSSAVRGDVGPAHALLQQPEPFDAWSARWQERLACPTGGEAAIATAMDAVNPVYIPRNHLVEEALAEATDGDLALFRRLLDVLARPFDERPGLERYAEPAPQSFCDYQTFCGT